MNKQQPSQNPFPPRVSMVRPARGATLPEAMLTAGLILVVTSLALRLLLSMWGTSAAIGNEQMLGEEAQRLLMALRADCRSAKELAARPETLGMIRFSIDEGGRVSQKPVSWDFSEGVMNRREGAQTKTFEFAR